MPSAKCADSFFSVRHAADSRHDGADRRNLRLRRPGRRVFGVVRLLSAPVRDLDFQKEIASAGV